MLLILALVMLGLDQPVMAWMFFIWWMVFD